MKTEEELSALKEEVETLCKKLAELTAEELAQVSGGSGSFVSLLSPSNPPVRKPPSMSLPIGRIPNNVSECPAL